MTMTAEIRAAADKIMGLADSSRITHGQVLAILDGLLVAAEPRPPTDEELRKFVDALIVFKDPRRSWEDRCEALKPFIRTMRFLMQPSDA